MIRTPEPMEEERDASKEEATLLAPTLAEIAHITASRVATIRAEMLTCEHPGCARTGASPQFTKSLRELGAGERQPKWFCTDHGSQHPRVSPTTGKPVDA